MEHPASSNDPASTASQPAWKIEKQEGPKAADGQDCVYGFLVRFLNALPVSDVRLEHELPEGATLLGFDPRPSLDGRRLTWQLGDMEPNQQQRVLVKVRTAPGREPPRETSATLRASYQLKTRVGQPRVAIALEAPESVLVGNRARFCVKVSNKGTATASGLRLNFEPNDGLLLPEGSTQGVELGNLAAGAYFDITLEAQAQTPGRFLQRVQLCGDDGLNESAETPLTLVQPGLALQIIEPTVCVLERETDARLRVSNPGTAEAHAVTVELSVPKGMRLLGAEGDGALLLDEKRHTLRWEVGALSPGLHYEATLRYVASEPGDLPLEASATANGGLSVQAQALIPVNFDEEQPSRILDDLIAEIEAESRIERNPDEGAPAATDRRRRRDYLVFVLGGTHFALPIAALAEVVRLPSVTPVPGVPSWVLGVANIHGDIISMLDLGAYLGIDTAAGARERHALMVRSSADDLTIGLVVDRIQGVWPLWEAELKPISSVSHDRLASVLKGFADVPGGSLAVLDLDLFLLTPALRDFATV